MKAEKSVAATPERTRSDYETMAIPALAELKALAKLLEVSALSDAREDIDDDDLFAIGAMLTRQHSVLFDVVHGLMDLSKPAKVAANG